MIVPQKPCPYLGARWCILCDRWKPLDEMTRDFGRATNGRLYGSGVCLRHDNQELSPRQRSLMHQADVAFGAAQ